MRLAGWGVILGVRVLTLLGVQGVTWPDPERQLNSALNHWGMDMLCTNVDRPAEAWLLWQGPHGGTI